jgi:hypothetical protein
VRRRDFVAFLSGAAAWVSAARAQEPRQVIGVLGTVSYGTGLVVAFLQGLKNTGFSEGRNVDVEYRWAESHYERMPSLATELIGRDVAVIVALDSPSAFAAKAATRTIPIVFVTGADPVKLGLVDSLNRPRGNLTGISFLVSVLAPKHLELLRELLPNSRRIALLVNPSNPNAKVDIPETQAAAHAFERHLEVLTASTENDLEAAFATMVQQRVDVRFDERREETERCRMAQATAPLFDSTNLGPSAHLRGMSGLPSIADIGQTLRHFWVLPKAVVSAVAIDFTHPDTADTIAPPRTLEIRKADVGPSRSVKLRTPTGYRG